VDRHWTPVDGHARLTDSFASADPQAVPVERDIAIEFSGNILWRYCRHPPDSEPFYEGLIQYIRVTSSARAFNGSVMRATLPAEITGSFHMMKSIRVDLR